MFLHPAILILCRNVCKLSTKLSYALPRRVKQKYGSLRPVLRRRKTIRRKDFNKMKEESYAEAGGKPGMHRTGTSSEVQSLPRVPLRLLPFETRIHDHMTKPAMSDKPHRCLSLRRKCEKKTMKILKRMRAG